LLDVKRQQSRKFKNWLSQKLKLQSPLD